MNLEEIRLECLRLAHDRASTPDEVIEAARKFSDFVLRTNDALVVNAVRHIAEPKAST